MAAILPGTPIKRLCLAFAVALISLVSGCVTTTTATLEGSVHSGESTFRFQSCDATARVEIILTRN